MSRDIRRGRNGPRAGAPERHRATDRTNANGSGIASAIPGPFAFRVVLPRASPNSSQLWEATLQSVSHSWERIATQRLPFQRFALTNQWHPLCIRESGLTTPSSALQRFPCDLAHDRGSVLSSGVSDLMSDSTAPPPGGITPAAAAASWPGCSAGFPSAGSPSPVRWAS